MLQLAYPAGLPAGDYFAVLSLLYEHMSNRCLAEAVALTFGREYIVVWNDVAKAVTTHVPKPETMERVRDRLRLAGYDQWIHEENSA